MKNKKKIIALSVIVFTVGLMSNIQYALDNYGIGKGALYTQVMATSTNDQQFGYYGKETTVKCTKQVKTTTTSNTGSSVNASASAGVSYGPVTGSVAGGASSSGSNSTTTETTITETFEAIKIYCVPRYSVDVCTPSDPCL